MEHLSKSVKEALELYLNTKRSDALLGKLEKLQRENPIGTTSAEEVKLITRTGSVGPALA